MKSASLLAVLLGPGMAAVASPVVLYEPGGGSGPTATPTDQGWLPVSSMLLDQHYFYAPGDGVTSFDSFPVGEGGAWTTIGLVSGDVLHPASPVLDAGDGFTLTFDLALDEEDHAGAIDIDGDGMADESGFTVLILDREAVGVALNFWEDRLWASSNDYVGDFSPLAQAEGVVQSAAAMATLRTYELTIEGGFYGLKVDGMPVLEGPTRSYDHFGLTINPFNKPNIINMGDATQRAGARARLGRIAIACGLAPSEPPVLTLGVQGGEVQLTWGSVAGASYTVQAGDDLQGWNDLVSLVADSTTAHHAEPITEAHPTRFFRVLRTLP